jgi:hypothetical protein
VGLSLGDEADTDRSVVLVITGNILLGNRPFRPRFRSRTGF